MSENNIFKIEKCGAYYLAHHNLFSIHFVLTRPAYCIHLDLSNEKTKELIDLLHLDCEDGKYISEILKGQYIHVIFNDKRRIENIGDPYGIAYIKVRGSNDNKKDDMQ